MRISFIIPGDPVSYLRMTQRQLNLIHIPIYRLSNSQLALRRRIEKYLAYKDFVRISCAKFGIDPKPKQKTYLNVIIYFGYGGWRCDPDNIRKGIQDAIFTDDRLIVGSVDYSSIDPKNPRVEVEIIL